jgi:hypothetical protein
LFFFLDKKEPKNQENLKLAYAKAGAARKIFGPTHNGSKGDCLGGQRFLFARLWRGELFGVCCFVFVVLCLLSRIAEFIPIIRGSRDSCLGGRQEFDHRFSGVQRTENRVSLNLLSRIVNSRD